MRCRIIEDFPMDLLRSQSEVLNDLELPFVPRVGELLEIRGDDLHGFQIVDVIYIKELPAGDWFAEVRVKQI